MSHAIGCGVLGGRCAFSSPERDRDYGDCANSDDGGGPWQCIVPTMTGRHLHLRTRRGTGGVAWSGGGAQVNGGGSVVVSPPCDQEQQRQQRPRPQPLAQQPRRFGRRSESTGLGGGISLGISYRGCVCDTSVGGGGCPPHSTPSPLHPPVLPRASRSTGRVPSRGPRKHSRIGEADTPGPPHADVVPPTHLSAPRPAPAPAWEPVNHLGDDDAHSEVWDDERLNAFLDDVERGAHADVQHETQSQPDLPYALYDDSPPSHDVDTSLRDASLLPPPATPRAVVAMDLDDPFGHVGECGDDEDDAICDLAADLAWDAPPRDGDVLQAMHVDEGPVDHYGNVAFIAARRFDGRKEGYVFQVGDFGLGYYLDTGPYLKGPLTDTSMGPAPAVIRLMDHIDFTADYSPPVEVSLFTLLALGPGAHDDMDMESDGIQHRRRLRAAHREARAYLRVARDRPGHPSDDRADARFGDLARPPRRPRARRRRRRRRGRGGAAACTPDALPNPPTVTTQAAAAM